MVSLVVSTTAAAVVVVVDDDDDDDDDDDADVDDVDAREPAGKTALGALLSALTPGVATNEDKACDMARYASTCAPVAAQA